MNVRPDSGGRARGASGTRQPQFGPVEGSQGGSGASGSALYVREGPARRTPPDLGTAPGEKVGRMCPSSGERDGTRGNGVGQDGMTNPRKIKAIAGNSASCLRLSIALPTGSSPVLLAKMKGPESKGSGPFAFSQPPVFPCVAEPVSSLPRFSGSPALYVLEALRQRGARDGVAGRSWRGRTSGA